MSGTYRRNDPPPEEDPAFTSDLMTPAEVAAMFRVVPKTVTRWANAGKLRPVRTIGGHRRYVGCEVREFFRRTWNREPPA